MFRLEGLWGGYQSQDPASNLRKGVVNGGTCIVYDTETTAIEPVCRRTASVGAKNNRERREAASIGSCGWAAEAMNFCMDLGFCHELGNIDQNSSLLKMFVCHIWCKPWFELPTQDRWWIPETGWLLFVHTLSCADGPQDILLTFCWPHLDFPWMSRWSAFERSLFHRSLIYPHDNCCKMIHFLGISHHFNLLIPCLKPCSPKEMVKRWWGLRQVSNYHSPTNFQYWWVNPEITAGTSPFLVGGLEHFLFSINIFWIILPIDFHIFQRGRYTTNQS